MKKMCIPGCVLLFAITCFHTHANDRIISTTPARGTIVLNGEWDFQPGHTKYGMTTNGTWGKIRVPGSWRVAWLWNWSGTGVRLLPGITQNGTGPIWSLLNTDTLTSGWYRTQVELPTDWQSRQYSLEFRKVSKNAKVYVNGRYCGEVSWPGGTCEILPAAAKTDSLDILIYVHGDASASGGATGGTRGLTDEVFLHSYPRGGHISDIFIQPSTRTSSLKLDVDLAGLSATGMVTLTPAAYAEDATVLEKSFAPVSVPVTTFPTATVSATWSWDNPRLWDVQQPELYLLKLTAKGTDIQDEYSHEFGFREFWIDGKEFYLNGIPIHLRPIQADDTRSLGVVELFDAEFDGLLAAGFNLVYLWPWDEYFEGTIRYTDVFCTRADKKGVLVVATIPYIKYLDVSNPSQREEWLEKMNWMWRLNRNHPSVVIWCTTPNYFGHEEDQDPRLLGNRDALWIERSDWLNKAVLGTNALALFKKYETTRPVYTHHGSCIGDIHTCNTYLDFFDLSERSDWFSVYATNGTMPFLGIEVGMPLNATMLRNRISFSASIGSEPFLTEYSAVYFGTNAYIQQTSSYREAIRSQYRADNDYRSWQSSDELNFSPVWQDLLTLFLTRTYRCWRTYGVNGGMTPWTFADGWDQDPSYDPDISIGTFTPGRRGVYFEDVPRSQYYYLQDQGMPIKQTGYALMSVNGATLAWIGGPSNNFTDSDHLFYSGEPIQRSCISLNDSRTTQNVSITWNVTTNEAAYTEGTHSTTLAPTEKDIHQVTFTAPSVPHGESINGKMYLTADIGSDTHTDTYAFTTFAATAAPSSPTVSLYDPVGLTSQMLVDTGYTVEPWNGETNSIGRILIGREVLSRGYTLPGSITDAAKNGSTVIVCTQNPDWLREELGVRVAYHVARRCFATGSHPVTDGINDEMLRDWNSAGTLVQATVTGRWTRYSNTTYPSSRYPPWGWHWGNQGSVCSAPVEIPHHSGWRPILVCDFALAFSPLMELSLGDGCVILCTLDLEDQVLSTPPARSLLDNLLEYAASPLHTPRSTKTMYIGNSEGENLLTDMQVEFTKVTSFDSSADLVILGANSGVSDTALTNYVSAGGHVVFLYQSASTPTPSLGAQFTMQSNFGGSLAVPSWDETRGMTPADIRFRSTSSEHIWILNGGADIDIAANGMLGRKKIGAGTVLYCQFSPAALPADTYTYFVRSQWTLTRALAYVLREMGCTFSTDISLPSLVFESDFYYSNYDTSFETGDDPYRYYRW